MSDLVQDPEKLVEVTCTLTADLKADIFGTITNAQPSAREVLKSPGFEMPAECELSTLVRGIPV